MLYPLSYEGRGVTLDRHRDRPNSVPPSNPLGVAGGLIGRMRHPIHL